MNNNDRYVHCIRSIRANDKTMASIEDQLHTIYSDMFDAVSFLHERKIIPSSDAPLLLYRHPDSWSDTPHQVLRWHNDDKVHSLLEGRRVCELRRIELSKERNALESELGINGS